MQPALLQIIRAKVDVIKRASTLYLQSPQVFLQAFLMFTIDLQYVL